MSEATNIIPTSEVIPAGEEPQILLPDGFADQFQHAYHEAVNGVRRVIVFGMMCLHVKRNLQHGRFGKWLKTNCPDLSHERVRQFMRLTEGIMGITKFQALLDFDRPSYELLALPDAEVPEEVRPIRDEIFNLIDGKSVYQLELDFGVRKPMKGISNNNPEGKNGGKRQEPAWTPEVLHQRALDVWMDPQRSILAWVDDMMDGTPEEPYRLHHLNLTVDELGHCTQRLDAFLRKLKLVLKERLKVEPQLTTGGGR